MSKPFGMPHSRNFPEVPWARGLAALVPQLARRERWSQSRVPVSVDGDTDRGEDENGSITACTRN